MKMDLVLALSVLTICVLTGLTRHWFRLAAGLAAGRPPLSLAGVAMLWLAVCSLVGMFVLRRLEPIALAWTTEQSVWEPASGAYAGVSFRFSPTSGRLIGDPEAEGEGPLRIELHLQDGSARKIELDLPGRGYRYVAADGALRSSSSPVDREALEGFVGDCGIDVSGSEVRQEIGAVLLIISDFAKSSRLSASAWECQQRFGRVTASKNSSTTRWSVWKILVGVAAGLVLWSAGMVYGRSQLQKAPDDPPPASQEVP